MTILRFVLATVLLCSLSSFAAAAHLTIAAASDLRYALDDMVIAFGEQHPEHDTAVIYGSSGRISTQIANGAPFDIFFSADIAYPKQLAALDMIATEPQVYAIGRLVLWSNTMDASQLRLADLVNPDIRRIAIAQPDHAPYGQRAREALQAVGIWDEVRVKLVYGENIAHTAQMTASGAADVGIIALSLALFPTLAGHPHHLLDDALHNELSQGFVITRYGADNPAARDFARFMTSTAAHEVMSAYGFVLPADHKAPVAEQGVVDE